jgi:hypothetical protein
VWKLVNVAPGNVRVNVRVAGDFAGPKGVQDDVTKLVYVSPGRVCVRVSTDGAVTGPMGAEHVDLVSVSTLLSVAVSVGPSLVEMEAS